MNEEEINGKDGSVRGLLAGLGFTPTPHESTPAVEDEPAKKQSVSNDSDIRFNASEYPPNTWKDHHRKPIDATVWGQCQNRVNWSTFETIVAVRAGLQTSHHNQKEELKDLCADALGYYDKFYKDAILSKGGPVTRNIGGTICPMNYSILPEHVFDRTTDPSYESSIKVRSEAKKNGNKEEYIKGLAIWKRYKEVKSTVQNFILPIESEVLPNTENPGSGCTHHDKVHGAIRKRYFESKESKTNKDDKWETWTDATFECYRVFGILGEKKGLFMRPVTSKQSVQPAGHPSMKEIQEEKKRKFGEEDKPKQIYANAYAEKTHAMMGETLKLKEKAQRTAKYEAKQAHLKQVLSELKFQITSTLFPDEEEELKKQYKETFQKLKDLECESTPQQSALTTAHRSTTTLATTTGRTSAHSNQGDEEDTSPTRPQKLFGSEPRKDKSSEEHRS